MEREIDKDIYFVGIPALKGATVLGCLTAFGIPEKDAQAAIEKAGYDGREELFTMPLPDNDALKGFMLICRPESPADWTLYFGPSTYFDTEKEADDVGRDLLKQIENAGQDQQVHVFAGTFGRDQLQ